LKAPTVNISTKELSGGARIYYIFGHALMNIQLTQNLNNQDIHTTIHNSTSPCLSLFVPKVAAFDLLIKPQIKLLKVPSLCCIELVYEELVKICRNCTGAVCSHICSFDCWDADMREIGIAMIPTAPCAARRDHL